MQMLLASNTIARQKPFSGTVADNRCYQRLQKRSACHVNMQAFTRSVHGATYSTLAHSEYTT